MGIPSYFSHIVKSHRNIIKKFNNFIKIDNFYLDCNSIIYDSLHELTKLYNISQTPNFETLLIEFVCNKITEYVGIINPSKKVYIAFDGVAPVAKLDQQRNRRYKSWFQKDLFQTLEISQDVWDTSTITPGTEFMMKLRDQVHAYFIGNEKSGSIEYIISCSDECGEGEHKIYDYIRNNADYHKTTKTVIYGLDADLFMLTLCNLCVTKNMYLFRETPHFIKSIDNTLNPNELYLIDIPALANVIVCDMSGQISPTTKSTDNLLFDYILICFMLGNDFLPHFPSINIRTNGIRLLMEAYNTVFKTNSTDYNLTTGKNIVWKNFRKFIEYLKLSEHDNIKSEMRIRDKWEKQVKRTTLQERIDNIPIIDREIEKYISETDENFESRYYKQLFDVDVVNDKGDKRKNQICINYLEGLEWTLKYYTTGCPDWRWTYKYKYPPLLIDLVRYIPYFDTELIGSENSNNPVSDKVQLCYVLPKSSLSLLPIYLKCELLTNHSEWYSDNCDISWAYCKYFWEAHIELPPINISDIERLISVVSAK